MFKIRKMMPEDRGLIYEILQQTDMFTMPEVSVAMEVIDTYLFNKDQKDYRIHTVVTETDEMAGYVCFGPTPATEGTYDLYWIVVSPAMQNRGYGKALLDFVENQVKEYNGRLLVVETSSQAKYSATRKFYQQNHYTLECRIKDFYRAGDDRLIFTKRFKNRIKEGKRKNGAMAENFTG